MNVIKLITLVALLTLAQAAPPSTPSTTPPEYHPAETLCLNLPCICRVLDAVYPAHADFHLALLADIDLVCPGYLAAVGQPCLQLHDLHPEDYDADGVPYVSYSSFCA